MVEKKLSSSNAPYRSTLHRVTCLECYFTAEGSEAAPAGFDHGSHMRHRVRFKYGNSWWDVQPSERVTEIKRGVVAFLLLARRERQLNDG